MKCPNCGYETPAPPPKPYEYTGYLKEYLPTILKLLRMGMLPGEVVATVQRAHHVELPWHASGMINYIRKRYGLETKNGPTDHRERDAEIARRYRAEKTTLRKLGGEYGISADRVRCIVIWTERKIGKQEEQQAAVQAAERIEDVPLESLDLPTRVSNCLKNGRYEGGRWVSECKTVGDVMKLKDSDLLRFPNFGRTSIRDWKLCLEELKRDFEARKQPAEARP
ncbi:hypothetical protein KIP88_03070 [Bradyrhizobium sp. SRL28]|uniref:DNA-directed RNA polymerase subunit alpha C-terminal domain-containing protein n=1 Tax=Bradyrhizobium sp. SRL28 TaxID=2836178 RepID=UPI001BDF5A50|nr:DNA-directed RNA polymerase subunit alpha C-terminal domain-containing protein [Bradyrhizobium sp. SRL28]MBT1509474.1 hypothetical protein [Bradyrhizobium sp. SRL28]